jgi:hypothetical protein
MRASLFVVVMRWWFCAVLLCDNLRAILLCDIAFVRFCYVMSPSCDSVM